MPSESTVPKPEPRSGSNMETAGQSIAAKQPERKTAKTTREDITAITPFLMAVSNDVVALLILCLKEGDRFTIDGAHGVLTDYLKDNNAESLSSLISRENISHYFMQKCPDGSKKDGILVSSGIVKRTGELSAHGAPTYTLTKQGSAIAKPLAAHAINFVNALKETGISHGVGSMQKLFGEHFRPYNTIGAITYVAERPNEQATIPQIARFLDNASQGSVWKTIVNLRDIGFVSYDASKRDYNVRYALSDEQLLRKGESAIIESAREIAPKIRSQGKIVSRLKERYLSDIIARFTNNPDHKFKINELETDFEKSYGIRPVTAKEGAKTAVHNLLAVGLIRVDSKSNDKGFRRVSLNVLSNMVYSMLIRPALSLTRYYSALESGEDRWKADEIIMGDVLEIELSKRMISGFLRTHLKESNARRHKKRPVKNAIIDLLAEAGPNGLKREELAKRLEDRLGKKISLQSLSEHHLNMLKEDGTVIQPKYGYWALANSP